MLIVKEKKLIFMMKTLHPKIYIFISIKHSEKTKIAVLLKHPKKTKIIYYYSKMSYKNKIFL